MFKRALVIALISKIGMYAGINHVESLNSRVNHLEESVFKKELPTELNEFSFGGEFLYWQTNMTGDIYVLSHNTISAPQFGEGSSLDTNVKAKTVNFDYAPGFRVYGSYQLPFDEWGLDLIWTSFQASASSSVSKTATLDLHCVWDTTSIMQASHASGKMRENFQVVDLNFGKMLMWSKPFSFRFYTGLKGALVNEKFTIVYEGTFTENTRPATETIVIKNDLKGIGLNNGLRFDWNLGKRPKFLYKGRGRCVVGRFCNKI